MVFDAETLEKLPTRGNRYVVSDKSRPGLAIKVSPMGSRAFYYRWKQNGKRLERKLIGTWDEVLSQYEHYRAAAEVVRQRPEDLSKLPPECLIRGMDLPQLCEAFLKDYVQPKLSAGSFKNYSGYLQRLQSSAQGTAFYHGRGDLQSARMTIKQLLLDVRDKENYPVLCARLKSCYNVMFNWAVERDLMRDSPMWGMPNGEAPKARSTHLTEPDLPRWLSTLALGEWKEESKDALRLMLLTGMRTIEIRQLCEQVRLPGGELHRVIRLEEDLLWLTGTKNGRDVLIPLSPPAKAIIERRLKGKHPESRLFPHGEFALIQVSKRCSKRAGTTVVTPHDLRRTFAIAAGRLGVHTEVISKLLNHAAPGVTSRHYALYDKLPERREAVEKLADYFKAFGPF